MSRLKTPIPVSLLVQDRESCLGMVGSPLHPASEVICKIVRDYVWRRLSSMLLHPNWILKWNNPQEAITKILSTNWILIDPSPGQPKWAEWAATSLAQRFRFFRSGLPRILYCNQCAPAAHESCPTCAAFSDIIGSGWILALLPMLVVPMGGLACTKDTTDAHGREHMRIYSNSYGDVLDVWCLHGTCIWELLACRDFGVPRRCRKDCTVESCRTWLVKGCPQSGRVSE